MRLHLLPAAVAVVYSLAVLTASASAQPPAPIKPSTPPFSATPTPPVDKPQPVEKIGPNTFRIGKVMVDTAKREVSATGVVNPAETLEFFANSVRGIKAYETAISLETDAISYNAALLLIGLDPSRSRPSKMQFDTTPPVGDPVEVWVEWEANGRRRRVKAEELIFDQRTKKPIAGGPWVYAGSTFYDSGVPGQPKMFLAEMEGVLIGFMHGPQALIDNPRNDTLGGFGYYVLNPTLGLSPNMAVTVTVKALPLDRKPQR